MKKQFLRLLLILCLLVGLLAVPAGAEELTTETGLIFSIDGTSVTITGYTGASAELVIPSVIAVPAPTEEDPDATQDLPVTAIGNSAFFGNSSLTKVVIPNGITSIGESAFLGCKNLVQVVLPEDLTVIPGSAFLGCHKLSQINIPGQLEYIGAEAFLYCDGLGTFTLPETLKAIGDSAFKESSLTSIVIPEGTTIGDDVFAWCDKLVSVTLPGDLTEIPQNTFLGCSSLSGIVIPETVETIGDQAFSTCSALTKVVLPESLETIGGHAFAYSGLKSITVPDSVTFLGIGAFSECDELAYAKIGNGVTDLDTATFASCEKLAQLHIGDGVTTIDPALWQDLNIAIFEFGTGITATYPTIPKAWFSGDTNIQQLTMHGDVDKVADYAFADCTNLQKVIFTETVNLNVGTFGFRGCTKLESLLRIVDASAEAPEYTTIYLHTVGDNGFIDCSSLRNVDIAIGGHLGARSFMACTSLTELNVRSSATIGEEAFALCSNLETVYLYTRSIGTGAFKACAKLKTAGPAYGDGNYNVRYWFDDYLGSEMSYFTYLETLVVGEGITQLYSNALYGCLYLQEVHLPSTMSYISWNAFPAEGSLTKVTIPTIGDWLEINFESTSANPLSFGAGLYVGNKLVEDLVIPKSVKNVGSYNFAGYEKLKSLTMESGVETLGQFAFYNCKNLDSITFANTLTKMGYSTFDGCTKVKRIVLPDRLMAIPERCFQNCTSLQEVQMPKYMSTISDYAFSGCIKLKTVLLPDFLTEIGAGAFYRCSSLTGIDLPSDVTSIGSYAFAECTALESIVLPDKILNLSEYLFNGCTELADVTLPANLLGIGNGCFGGCKALKQIDLPNTIKQMGDMGVFNSCGLTSVDMPDAMTVVPSGCFSYCTDLASVTLHEGITGIGSSAFENTALTSINLPESLTGIYSYAFSNCQQLSELQLPAALETLGENVFNSCHQLRELTIPEGCSISQYAIQNSGINTLYIPTDINTVAHSLYCASLQDVTFIGDMPELHSKTFSYSDTYDTFLHLAALYPEGNATYTKDKMVNYGASSIEWYPYDETGVKAGGSAATVNWKLEGGKLTVWGTGDTASLAVKDPMNNDFMPWYRLAGHIKTAEVQEGITALADRFVQSSRNLTVVSLPNSLQDIGSYAFAFCEKLVNIDLPDKLNKLGNYAFSGTPITELTLPGSITIWGADADGWYALNGMNQLKTITFGEGIVALPHYLCSSMPALETIHFPSTLRTMGYTFISCPNLKNVVLPEGIQDISDAFQNCDALTEITIPGSISSLNCGFRNCDGLTTVIVEEGMTSMSDAFDGCTALKNVTLPSTLWSIGMASFRGCTSLEEIVIPSGVGYISNEAFKGCTKLSKVTLPLRELSIDSNAFSGCGALTELTFIGDAPKPSDTAFAGLSATIYYPANNPTWKNFNFANYGGKITWKALANNCTTHTFTDWSTVKPATCTEDGTARQTCTTCGAYAEKGIPALGHVKGTLQNKVEVDVCREGYSEYSCSRCGSWFRTDIVAGQPHEWCDWSSQGGNCKDGCWIYRNCERCEASESKYIEPTSHTFGPWSNEQPTCNNSAWPWRRCTVCGFEEMKEIQPTGHSYGDWIVDSQPTCYNDGSQHRVCANCGEWEYGNIPHLEHSYKETVIKANCMQGGYILHQCTKCGEKYETDHQPSTGVHSWTAWSNEQPTCTESAWPWRRCTVCNFEEMKEIPSTGHKWSAWTIIRQPNYDSSGLEERKCTTCGETEARELPALTPDQTYNPFVDVVAGKFYETPVLWAVENGVTNGTSATTFAPNDKCTRAQVVTFLWRAAGSPEPKSTKNPFVDVVAGKFYYKAVLWAVENGITNGVDATHFGTNDECTRGHVATFLWRTLGKPAASSSVNPFNDVVKGKFYYDAVLWAAESGVTTGLGNGKFAPGDTCTRGQIVTFLYRAMANK